MKLGTFLEWFCILWLFEVLRLSKHSKNSTYHTNFIHVFMLVVKFHYSWRAIKVTLNVLLCKYVSSHFCHLAKLLSVFDLLLFHWNFKNEHIRDCDIFFNCKQINLCSHNACCLICLFQVHEVDMTKATKKTYKYFFLFYYRHENLLK